MNRRDFLKTTTLSTALAVAPNVHAGAGAIHRSHDRPLRVLFLGGTNFVGPAIVEVALQRGHEVTLFNRGKTNPWLFTYLERLVGDRERDPREGLRPLHGGRTWDVVIDTWQGSPLAVRHTAELLRDRTLAYLYVSSIAVYQGRNYVKSHFNEDAELPAVTMPDAFEDDVPYPTRKLLGERAVQDAFGSRSGIFRAYGIQGTDPAGRLPAINYWVARSLAGGQMLAPGDGADYVQWTDVRDLAELIVHSMENRIRGVYNVSTGARFDHYLSEIAALCANPPRLTWVPAEFLFEQGLESFTDIPSWVWRGEREHGFFHARNDRALSAGLRPRSARETFRPVVDAMLLHHADHDLTGPGSGAELARREGEMLAQWLSLTD